MPSIQETKSLFLYRRLSISLTSSDLKTAAQNPNSSFDETSVRVSLKTAVTSASVSLTSPHTPHWPLSKYPLTSTSKLDSKPRPSTALTYAIRPFVKSVSALFPVWGICETSGEAADLPLCSPHCHSRDRMSLPFSHPGRWGVLIRGD